MQPIRLREVILTLLAAGGAFVIGSSSAPVTSVDSTTVTAATLAATTSQVATQRIGGSNGATVDGFFKADSLIDAASIASGAATSADITVTGAGTSDNCLVNISGTGGVVTSSIALDCSVTAANTATVYLYNSTTTAVNLSAATYTVMVTSY